MKDYQKHILSHYSAFAAMFLFCKTGQAEAIYTDIDPDILLSLDNDVYNIDINNDGLLDFKLQKISGSFYSYWSEHLSYAYYVAISPWQSGNRMAGLKSVIDPSYGGFTQYFPFALDLMNLINGDLTFQNNNFEILAYKIRNDDGGGGPSGGEWFYNSGDHFLGVVFVDLLNCNHYGWIRCEAIGGADLLILKDYAFETKCETGIYAGDTIGDTSTVEVAELSSFVPTLYCYAGFLNISLNNQLVGANYTVFNLEGKIIHTGYLDEVNNKLNINCNDGIYLVIIKKDEYSYSKQILLTK